MRSVAILSACVCLSLATNDPASADDARSLEYRIDEYLPVGPPRRAVYVKTVQYAPGRTVRSELTRQVGQGSGRVRVTDSDGEYQEYAADAAGPAMAGQSMRAQGFEQRYEPALTLFPALARVGEPVTFEAAIEHRALTGSTRGRVVRRVVLEAVEAVDVAAGHFEGCLRFRVDQENRPRDGGPFVAETHETVWLAPGVGEVKSTGTTTLRTGSVPFLRAEVELSLARVSEPI
jgi:hypothetical protein